MVLDTNIVIYACQPGGAVLLPWTGSAEASVASVTRVEALGFHGIGQDEEADLRAFLADCAVLPLDDEVIERAVLLRQQKKMKLGDAIIAATALEYGQPLVTRNVDDFKHIPGLQLVNPFEAGLP